MAGGGVGLAVFLTALTVKALDDLIDEPEGLLWMSDVTRVFAYSLLFLVAAAGVAPGATVSLFLCAYALGMAPTPGERLPSGLPSWAESLGAVLFAALVTGPLETAGSLLLLAGIQVVDDLWDVERDRSAGTANIALAVGRRAAAALAVLFFAGALLLSPPKALAGAVMAAWLVFGPGPALGPVLGSGRGEAVSVGVGTCTGGARGQRSPFGAAAAGVASVTLAGLAAVVRPAGFTFSGVTALGDPQPWLGGVIPLGGGSWFIWFGSLALAAAATSGLLLAYRRGHAAGLSRGRAAREALNHLMRRAGRLERDL